MSSHKCYNSLLRDLIDYYAMSWSDFARRVSAKHHTVVKQLVHIKLTVILSVEEFGWQLVSARCPICIFIGAQNKHPWDAHCLFPFRLRGRGCISVKNMHLIDDIICTRYWKNTKLHTNTLSVLFSSASNFCQYYLFYATTPNEKLTIEISTDMATKWDVTVANSVTAIKHTGRK